MKDSALRQPRQTNRRSTRPARRGAVTGDLVGDAIVVLGDDLSIAFWSPGAARLTGYAADRVANIPLAEILEGIEADDIVRASQTGLWLEAESTIPAGSRERRRLELSVSLLCDRSGMSGYAVAMRDPADSVGDIAIDRGETSQGRRRATDRSAPAFLVALAAGRILDANDAALSLLGLGIKEVAGRNLDNVLRSRGAVVGAAAGVASSVLDGIEVSVPDADSDGLSRAYLSSVLRLRERGRRLAVVALHEMTQWLDLEAQLQRANVELSRMARHDHLTGLFNKPMFLDTLALANARLERTGGMLGVLYIDLDGFKPVNDRFGHDAGDRVLVEVAQRIRRAVRASDVVARLGGDEFGAILENLRIPDDAMKVGRHIIGQIAEPLDMDGERIVMSASIGAVVTDRRVPDSGALLIQADWQMYRAKSDGQGQVSVGRVESPGGERPDVKGA